MNNNKPYNWLLYVDEYVWLQAFKFLRYTLIPGIRPLNKLYPCFHVIYITVTDTF